MAAKVHKDDSMAFHNSDQLLISLYSYDKFALTCLVACM